MNRDIVLLEFTGSEGRIVNEGDFTADTFAALQNDLTSYFTKYRRHLGHQGLIYSRSQDYYFFVHKLPASSTIYLLSSHQISSSVSWFYNNSIIKKQFFDIFSYTNKQKLLNSDAYRTNVLMRWREQFTKLTPEIVPDFLGGAYYEDMYQFIKTRFEDHLAEFYYSLSVSIPIIVKEERPREKVELEEYLKSLFDLLNIYRGSSPLDQHQQAYVVSLPSLEKFDEYLYLDNRTKSVKVNFFDPQLSGLTEVVKESMQLHEEEILPFQVHLINNLFWNIQKIYGVLAFHDGKIDFRQFLDSSKIHFKGLLNQIFRKTAFLKDILVE